MLPTLIATIVVFGLAVAAMAVGVIVQGKRLKGSCGGTGKDCTCSPADARKCRLREMREAASASSSST